MKLFRYAASVVILAVFASTAPLWSAGTSSAKNYLDEGVNLYQQERYFEAVDSLRNAIDINPYYGDAYRYLAEVYFSLGDYKTSLENSLTALKYANNDPDVMLVVANSYREMSTNDNAAFVKSESYYNKIIDKFPAYSEVYRNQAELYMKMNRLPQALTLLIKADRVNKKSWKNYISFGKYYIQSGDPKRAEEYFKNAFNIDPEERPVYTALAEFYRSTGNYDKAIELLESGNQLFENFYSGNLILADCYLATGPAKKDNLKKAIELYKDLFKWIGLNGQRNNDSPKGWNLYKTALAYESIDKDSSVNYYRQAVKTDPANDIALFSFESFALNNFKVDSPVRKELSAIHVRKADEAFKRGESRNYMLNLKRSITLYPFNTAARQKLVNYFELAHDPYSAYQELKSLEKIDPSSKVKDKIANYDWDLKNSKLVLHQPRSFIYKGLFVVNSDQYNFAPVFSGMFIYFSEYFNKFKFSTIEYRKKQGINAILEYLRNYDYSYFIIADLADGRDILKFTLYDKTARQIDGTQVNFRMEDMYRSGLGLLEWLDANLPSAWVIGSEEEPNTYHIAAGANDGLKVNDTLAAIQWDDGNFQPLSLLKVKKAEDVFSVVTLSSNFSKGQRPDLNDKYALKSAAMTPNSLNKLKKILGY